MTVARPVAPRRPVGDTGAMPSPAAEQALVGRRRALDDFATWLDRARQGVPRVVLCGGEQGIGKTRLASEYARLAGSAGMEVAWARAHDDHGTPPFWLWRQLLRPLGVASLDALERGA